MRKNKRGLLVLASAACVFLVTSCVNREEEKTSYKLTVTTDEGVEKVTIKSGDNEVSDFNSIEEGTKLTAVIDLKDDFETSAVTLDGTEVAVTDGTYAFTMPSKDATLDVKTKSTLPPDVEEPVVNEFKLTITKDEHISSVKVFDGETEITDLTKVEKGKVLTVKVEAQEDFTVDTVKFNGQVVTPESDGTYKVTMADKDSTLEVASKAVLKEYVVSISRDNHVEVVLKVDGEEVDSDNKVLEGSTVTVEVTCEAHYVVDEVLMNDEALNAQDGVYTFVMPQEDVDLEISSKSETISTNISVNADALEKATVSMKLAGKDYTFGTDVDVSYNSLAVLTVVPKEGFKVKSVKFDNQTLALNGTTAQFNVTSGGNHALTIEFAEEMEFTYVDLTAEVRMNQFKEFEVKVNGNAAKEDTVFFEGDEIEFSALLSSYSTPREQIVFHTLTDAFTGADERVTVDESGTKLTYTFELNEETSTILVAYNRSIDTTGTSGVSIDFETDGDLKVYGFVDGAKYNAKYMTLIFERPDENYTIDKITATYADGSNEVLGTDKFMENWNGLYGRVNLNGDFSLKGSVTFKIEGSVKQTYNVKYVGKDDVTAYSSTGGDAFKTSYREGEQVVVYNIKPVDNNKYIKDIKIDGVESPNITISGTNVSYNFVMPANEVTITITLADKGTFSITGDEGFADYHVSDRIDNINDLESAIPGTTLYVFVDVKDGYLPVSATVGEDLMEIQHTTIYASGVPTLKYYVQVTMPNEGDLKVSFKTQKAYTVSYEQNSDYRVSLSGSGNTFAEGSKVNFNVYVNNQAKRVKDVTVTDETGQNKVEVSSSGAGGYSFVMPAYDVKINVDLEDLPSKNITVRLVNSTGETTLDAIVNSVSVSTRTGPLVNFSSYNPQPTVTLEDMLEGVNATLLEGSVLNLSFGVSGGYSVSVNLVNKEGEKTPVSLTASQNGSSLMYYANNLTAPSDLETIEIEISKAEPVTITVVGGEGVEYTLISNGEQHKTETVELDFMASFTFEVTSEAGEGHAYVYKVTKVDGTEVTADRYGNYSATEDLTITIEKIKAYTYILDNQTDVTVYSTTLSTADYKSYSAGTLFTEPVTISSYSFSFGSPVNFELKVGDKVVASGTGQSSYYERVTFEITGNVVLTITPVE